MKIAKLITLKIEEIKQSLVVFHFAGFSFLFKDAFSRLLEGVSVRPYIHRSVLPSVRPSVHYTRI